MLGKLAGTFLFPLSRRVMDCVMSDEGCCGLLWDPVTGASGWPRPWRGIVDAWRCFLSGRLKLLVRCFVPFSVLDFFLYIFFALLKSIKVQKSITSALISTVSFYLFVSAAIRHKLHTERH